MRTTAPSRAGVARSLGRLVPVALIVLIAVPAAAQPAQDVFVLEGRGNGHGVGMAQDSAQAMAAAGAGHEQILSHFYPGAGRGRRSSAIRVAVWEAGAPSGQVAVTVPGGARVSGDGRSADAPAGAVLQVSADAAGYHVRQVAPTRGSAVRSGLLGEPSASPSPSDDPLPGGLPSAEASASPSPEPSGSPSPLLSQEPSPSAPPPAEPSPSGVASPAASESPAFAFDSGSPLTVSPLAGSTISVSSTGRSYRGSMVALSRQGFRLVNVLDIEDYLRGLGEVPAGWHMAALRTQAVAARTYALRAVRAGQPLGYDVCDDTRCQVYLGVQGEAQRTTQAARDTRGQVVTYRGALADTFYSANAGGVTATPGEGFGGSTTIPYLPAGIPAPGGLREWRLTVAPQDVAGRLGYSGRLTAISIAQKGPSGRATRVRLEGSAGSVEMAGVAFQRRLGLRSTLFTIVRTTGQAEALPAADAGVTQLNPAEAATAPALPDPVGPTSSSARLRSGTPFPQIAAPTAEEGVPRAALLAAAAALTLAAAAQVAVHSRSPRTALRR